MWNLLLEIRKSEIQAYLGVAHSAASFFSIDACLKTVDIMCIENGSTNV